MQSKKRHIASPIKMNVSTFGERHRKNGWKRENNNMEFLSSRCEQSFENICVLKKRAICKFDNVDRWPNCSENLHTVPCSQCIRLMTFFVRCSRIQDTEIIVINLSGCRLPFNHFSTRSLQLNSHIENCPWDTAKRRTFIVNETRPWDVCINTLHLLFGERFIFKNELSSTRRQCCSTNSSFINIDSVFFVLFRCL